MTAMQFHSIETSSLYKLGSATKIALYAIKVVIIHGFWPVEAGWVEDDTGRLLNRPRDLSIGKCTYVKPVFSGVLRRSTALSGCRRLGTTYLHE